MGPRQRESYLSERVCSLSRRICYQFDLGRRCAWPSDATTVDSPDAIVQENSSHGRFQYGRCVSICFLIACERAIHSLPGNTIVIHRSI